MKKILIPISTLLLSGVVQAQLSFSENYVYSKTYLDYNGTSATKSSETVQYFDGLGRPKQIVNVKASPTEKDVVTHIEYDSFGRQVKDYLPIPQQGTQNGVIYTSPLINATHPSLYGSEKIYSEKILENSPLDRVLGQKQVGTAWDNKPVQFGYAVNADGDVKKYIATFNYTTFSSSLTLPGSYGTGQLYKNTVTDEDGNQTTEFKNGKGQLLLVRKVIGATENADTYYVYNDYDQLAFVIPPKASVATDPNAVLNDLCYQYKYDGRNRLVEKKIPGKGWEFMIYDKQDRLVGTQDAELRAKGQWLYTKYDQFGRVAVTGLATGGERNAEQQLANDSGSMLRTTSSVFNRQGMDVFYDPAISYPHASKWVALLSVNYYDSYPAYSFNPAFPSAIQGEPVLTDSPAASGRNTKGLPVMSFVKNIEDDSWTKSYTYYDTKGRAIGGHSINHLGGYTHTESKLDFAGLALQTITTHLRKAGETGITVKERFVYDSGNRLKEHYHQVDSNPEELLAKNSYNELSQLVNKELGNNLQSIDYAYNIRGWMTDINKNQMSLTDLGGKLFSYKIKYNQKDGIDNPDPVQFAGKNVTPKFNGNIAEVDWRAVETLGVNPSLTPKRYGYTYDALNRLTAGYYQNPNNQYSKENTESLAYDLNGNITDLYRTGVMEYGSNTATVIDNLSYIYNGNRATNINDYSYNSTGYEGGGNTIDYSLNGNIVSMPDKGISQIKYNYLNLPNSLALLKNGSENITINTKYRADGIKLTKEDTTIITGFNGYTTTKKTTDYLDGFQYLKIENTTSGGSSEMLMASSLSARALQPQAFSVEPRITAPPAKTPDLQFFPTSEGFYDYLKNQYIYQYKDHLGNVRVSFGRNSADVIEIVDSNDYYPFGMNHLKTGNSYFGVSSYKAYKKELQETGMYDYGWRQYMPDVGRWMQSDPLIKDLDFTFNPNDVDDDDDEVSNISAGILLSNGGGIFNVNNLNPYAYGYNDPIKFNDPDGRCPTCLTALGGALIGGGLELGGQLLSGKSLNDVDWADVGIETLKGGLIGSGVGAGAAAAIEGGSIVTKAAIDIDVNKGNQNVFNGKKTVGKAVVDGAMDFAAGKVGGFVAKKLNGAASKALAKATTAEVKAARVLTRTTNTFNRVTANGTNTYGSRALNAKQSMSKAASSLKFARKNTAAAKIVKAATQYGSVVNKAAQNSISDKIKSFFGIN